MAYSTHKWSMGVEAVVDPTSETVTEGKSMATRICDDLATDASLPEELRLVDADSYLVECYESGDTLVINHFEVFRTGGGLGSHLVRELCRVARHHDLLTIEIWIGANEPGTDEFLTANGFEWVEEPHHETYGRTLAGYRPTASR